MHVNAFLDLQAQTEPNVRHAVLAHINQVLGRASVRFVLQTQTIPNNPALATTAFVILAMLAATEECVRCAFPAPTLLPVSSNARIALVVAMAARVVRLLLSARLFALLTRFAQAARPCIMHAPCKQQALREASLLLTVCATLDLNWDLARLVSWDSGKQ